MRVLMVCLGNICRSPLAEGILKEKAKNLGINIMVDSAGTGGWHEGEPPDPRSQKIAEKYGIDISNQRARKFKTKDFQNFDIILAMDNTNQRDLQTLANNESERKKVKPVLSYLYPGQQKNVPDPYYGNLPEFEEVFLLLDKALDNFLKQEYPTIKI